MRRSILFLLLGLAFNLTGLAQDKMYIHKTDKITLGALVAKTDSIFFNSDGTITYFRISGNLTQYQVADIDSISFGDDSSTIYVTYDGTSAAVINPLAFEGVSVTVSGADVIVNSSITNKEITCVLSGTTANGMFKIYSNYKYKLSLNGVSITNTVGPAINIQSHKKCTFILVDGTYNSLADGSSYVTSTEDQKATLFSEGQIELQGTGSLSVKSVSRHAICSDDYINILEGKITISGAGKDGIHTNDYFKMSGGTLNVTATSDGIESESGYILISGGSITTVNASAGVNGMIADSILTISGGTINMTISGNKSKGIKSGNKMTLSGGKININTSGATVLASSGSGYDPSYCEGIKCDSTLTISGADITIESTGNGGKGISSDSNIIITSGTLNLSTSGAGATYKNSTGVTDSYSSSCIASNGNITITGGSITASSSGIAGKGIKAGGVISFGNTDSSPIINVTTTGTRLLVSGTGAAAVYADPKAVKSDGALVINNGNFTVSTSQPGGTGFDSGSTLAVNGGTLNASIAGNQTKEFNSAGIMTFSGGTLTINTSGGVVLESSGSGYDPSYCSGIKGNSDIVIKGGSITITNTGTAGKGISSDTNLSITGGTVNITNSGSGASYKNSSGSTDTYAATCLKTNGNMSITGGNITLSSSGAGGRGIISDGTLTVGEAGNTPTLNVTTTGSTITTTDYEAKAVKVDGDVTITSGSIKIASADDGIKSKSSVTINGGEITISNSYEGIEAPYITMNDGNVNVMASNDGINTTKSTASGGTEKNDGSCFYMKGGYMVSSCSAGDAVDSNGNFSMTGGTLILHGPPSQPEQAIDVNGPIIISGGFFIAGSTNSNMNKAMDSSSAQYGIYATTNSAVSANTIFRIQDSGGNDMVTFKPQRTSYVFLFSSPNLKSGSTYSVYTGGTCSGTLKDGLYTGGSYSGGILKKSFTISNRVTSLSF